MGFTFKKSSIPNYLTIFRILLVPIIIGFTCTTFGPALYSSKLSNSGYVTTFYLSQLLAGILFLIASFTDFLDGYLSRKYHWVSDFGKLWDPIADKILINSVLIIFAGANCNGRMLVFFIIPILMIIRDTIVDACRMYAASKNIVVAANIYGKMKTLTQIIAIAFIYFFFSWNYFDISSLSGGYTVWWWLVQNLFMWISLALSIISGCIYVYRITKTLNALKVVNTVA